MIECNINLHDNGEIERVDVTVPARELRDVAGTKVVTVTIVDEVGKVTTCSLRAFINGRGDPVFIASLQHEHHKSARALMGTFRKPPKEES